MEGSSQGFNMGFGPEDDAAAKRRAANRVYSKNYRDKKDSYTIDLESQEKKLKELIAEGSLELKLHEEDALKITVENEALEKKYHKSAAEMEAIEAKAAKLEAEKQHLKNINQIKKLRLKDLW